MHLSPSLLKDSHGVVASDWRGLMALGTRLSPPSSVSGGLEAIDLPIADRGVVGKSFPRGASMNRWRRITPLTLRDLQRLKWLKSVIKTNRTARKQRHVRGGTRKYLHLFWSTFPTECCIPARADLTPGGIAMGTLVVVPMTASSSGHFVYL
ncbi:hypothetical protein LSAT2_013032 [Lamellibrachia satsuma]|nr:hypothetical protein LSAT2_013032 [Lamellibrachia satsuma]